MKIFAECFVLILASLSSVVSENILFFYGGGTYSHEIGIWNLVQELHTRGHNITFVSAYTKKPTMLPINIVVPQALVTYMASQFSVDRIKSRETDDAFDLWLELPDWVIGICDILVNNASDSDPPHKALLDKKSTKFDLILIDAVVCDCGYIFAHYFNVKKVILADSTSILPWHTDIFNLPPSEASWIPIMSSLTTNYPMTLWDRTQNYLEYFYWLYRRRTYLYPAMEKLTADLLKTNKNIPSFSELEKNTSLVFINTHATTDFPRALPEQFVRIGGMQLWSEPTQKIPEDMNKFMEGAKDGVVLIALGSSLDNVPDSYMEIFINATKKFPNMKFIWRCKCEYDDVPPNLLMSDWIPQQDILSHPKVVAFISHGGLNGNMEALFYSVPLIILPIFGDQDTNGYRIQIQEIGIRLEFKGLTSEILSNAINKITTDSKYKSNIVALSKAFRDRPMSPIELAVYWTEYVLKHDTHFMKPTHYSSHLNFLQIRLIDVYFCIMSVILSPLLVAYIIFRLAKHNTKS